MIVQILSSSRGGAASHVQAVTEGLVARGETVAVVMPFDGGNVRPEALGGARVIEWRGPRALAQQLRSLQPVAVHAHGSRAALWGACSSVLAGQGLSRLVYSLHGFVTPFHREPRRTLQLLVERLVASRCRAVVADAQAERHEALRWGLTTPERVRTVYLGFDLDPWLALGAEQRRAARAELELDPQGWHLLCVCRLDRPRDLPTLLEAFSQVAARHPQAYLHVVGGGPQLEETRARAASVPRARLWGLVPDVRLFYAAADAFVLTSWGWEGCPVTVIEAHAAGLPVAVTDAGGSREAIIPGRSGLLVPRRAPVELAAALERLCTDPGDFGRVGREHVRRNFRPGPMLDQLQRIYGCATRTT